jgi:hypothetical protein
LTAESAGRMLLPPSGWKVESSVGRRESGRRDDVITSR